MEEVQSFIIDTDYMLLAESTPWNSSVSYAYYVTGLWEGDADLVSAYSMIWRWDTKMYCILLLRRHCTHTTKYVSDSFRSLETFELGALSPQPPSKKKFCTGSEFLFIHCSYLHIRFDLLGFINFRDINGVPKLGVQNPYSKVVPLDSTGMISC